MSKHEAIIFYLASNRGNAGNSDNKTDQTRFCNLFNASLMTTAGVY
jgi:hypothetical protein